MGSQGETRESSLSHLLLECARNPPSCKSYATKVGSTQASERQTVGLITYSSSSSTGGGEKPGV